MKILHVFGGGVMSGVESHVLAIASALSREGAESILAPLQNGPFAAEARAAGLEVCPAGKRFRGDPLTVYRLARLIRRKRIDVVHTHGNNGNLYGRLAARLAGNTTLVSTIHAFYEETLRDRYRSALLRRWAFRLDLAMARWCDALIVVTPALRESLVKAGLEASRIVVIPNGIDVAKCRNVSREQGLAFRAGIGLGGSDRVVGTVGRLSPVKNVSMLLHAARLVLAEMPAVKFLIVGDGPQRRALEALAAELGVARQTVFAGWLDKPTVCIAAMDVFALTSMTEGTSFALLDAMALAKPVVVTDVGGNRHLVADGETGWLVPANDAGAFARQLVQVLSDPDRARQMGRQGSDRVAREFQEQDMCRAVMALYGRLAPAPR